MTVSRETMNLARFPVSGAKPNLTRDDYALEAALLRAKAGSLYRRAHDTTNSGRLYELARRFDRISRMLGWQTQAPSVASQPRPH